MTGRDVRRAMFVGSYASGEQPGIHCLMVGADGTLQRHDAWSGVENPSYLAVHPNGTHLYAVSETGVTTDDTPGTVHAFRIDVSTAGLELVPLGSRPSGGDHPCHLRIHPNGRWLVVSNYGSGSFAVLGIEPKGTLGAQRALIRHVGSGPNPDRQQGPHVHSSIFTPDGGRLIVADLGIDQLVTYGFDPLRGIVTEGSVMEMPPGFGPRHLAFHPDGRHLLVVGELDSTIALLRYDPDLGTVRLLTTLPTLPVDAPDNLASHIHISESGRHVYVSNRGHDSIATYDFDPTVGLSLGHIRPCGGRVPRAFTTVPGEGHLLVANQASDQVVLLPLSRGGADIEPPVAHLDVPAPSVVVDAAAIGSLAR